MTLSPSPLPFLLKPFCLLQVSINHTVTHSDQQSLEIDNYLDSSILDSSFPTFPGLRAEVTCFPSESWTGCLDLCAPLQEHSVHPQLSVQELIRSSASGRCWWCGRATALHLYLHLCPGHSQVLSTSCLQLLLCACEHGSSSVPGHYLWRRAGSWMCGPRAKSSSGSRFLVSLDVNNRCFNQAQTSVMCLKCLRFLHRPSPSKPKQICSWRTPKGK